MRKVACLLVALMFLFSFAFAEGVTVKVVQDDPDSFFTSLLENLGVENWEELPSLIRSRVNTDGWGNFQEKLSAVDWSGILESVQSFFSEKEWTSGIGEKVSGLIEKVQGLGISSVSQITDLIGSFDLSSFKLGSFDLSSFDLSGLDLSSITESLGGGLGDVLSGIGDALTNLGGGNQ